MSDREPRSNPRRRTPAGRRARLFETVLLLACATGCEAPCSARFEVADRDWCTVERVADASRWGRLDEARILVDQISTSQARAAAVEAALSLSPRGVSAAAIGEWCDLLDGNSAPRCRLTWGLASQ